MRYPFQSTGRSISQDFTPKLQSRPKPVSTGVENESLTEIACSRLRDSGESVKSRSKIRKRAGAGERRGGGAFFPPPPSPLPSRARLIFALLV